jgi:TrwC relaxase
VPRLKAHAHRLGNLRHNSSNITIYLHKRSLHPQPAHPLPALSPSTPIHRPHHHSTPQSATLTSSPSNRGQRCTRRVRFRSGIWRGRVVTALIADVRRLTMSQERYYTRHLADSREEYYTGKGEAPGRWAGPGLQALGLAEGERVTPETFGRMFHGQHPYRRARAAGGQGRLPGVDPGVFEASRPGLRGQGRAARREGSRRPGLGVDR